MQLASVMHIFKNMQKYEDLAIQKVLNSIIIIIVLSSITYTFTILKSDEFWVLQ